MYTMGVYMMGMYMMGVYMMGVYMMGVCVQYAGSLNCSSSPVELENKHFLLSTLRLCEIAGYT